MQLEVLEDYRTLHSKRVHNLHCEPNVNRTCISRRMRRMGHVEGMEETYTK